MIYQLQNYAKYHKCVSCRLFLTYIIRCSLLNSMKGMTNVPYPPIDTILYFYSIKSSPKCVVCSLSILSTTSRGFVA